MIHQESVNMTAGLNHVEQWLPTFLRGTTTSLTMCTLRTTILYVISQCSINHHLWGFFFNSLDGT